ncbi:hypothetical protein J6590_065280 [Homalodisca vitripennis]|nr:hypothetical protein J6590_065280 [Homalodisca vitripennis]
MEINYNPPNHPLDTSIIEYLMLKILLAIHNQHIDRILSPMLSTIYSNLMYVVVIRLQLNIDGKKWWLSTDGHASAFGKLATRGEGVNELVFGVGHLIMSSLNTRFDEMSSLVTDFGFHVFGVTETWLHPFTPSDNFIIHGYTLLRSDQKLQDRQTYGGVVLFRKPCIIQEQRFLSQDVGPGVEYVCAVMKGKRSQAQLDAKHLRRLWKESNAAQVVNEPIRVTASSATLLHHTIVDKSVEVERNGIIDVPSLLDIGEEEDNGNCSIMVMLNYSKTFDSINHDMLLAKMNYNGFGEEAVMWIRSYLGDRKKVTKLGNDTSQWVSKLRGVSQVLYVALHDLMRTLDESGIAVVLDGEGLTVCDKVKTHGVVLDRDRVF